MRSFISTLLVAVAGLALAGAAGAEQRYTDTAGDSGAAPDLGQVTVSNDSGHVVFKAAVPARLPEPDEAYFLGIDSDGNAGTGSNGLELRVFEMGVSSFVESWNKVSGEEIVASDYSPDGSGAWRYEVVLNQCANEGDDDGDGKVDVQDAGCTDGEDDLESDDPYTLAIGRPTATPAAARSGAQVTVRAPIRQVETNQAITAGAVRCSAKIGASTKRWAGRLTAGTATCTLRAPKVSKPTSVRGSITVRSKSKTASTSFAFRVK
jgi:hypothetical protein